MKPKEKVLFTSTTVRVIAIQAHKYKDNSLVAAHHSIATCNGNGAHLQTQPKPISEKRKAYLERMDNRKREAATPLEYSPDPQ